MQSQQLDPSDEVTLMKLLNRIHVHEAQLKLLQETMENNLLLDSNELVFLTKADKGGATLIMNHTDVKEAIEAELFDQNKFTKLNSLVAKVQS